MNVLRLGRGQSSSSGNGKDAGNGVGTGGASQQDERDADGLVLDKHFGLENVSREAGTV